MNERLCTFSISGEFITKTARERCHDSYDLDAALKLLKSSLVCDQLTPLEIEHMAYDILNGKAEIKGTYPGPDYRFEEIKGKEDACDLGKTMKKMCDKIASLEEQLSELQSRYLYLCDSMPDYQLSRVLRAYGQNTTNRILGSYDQGTKHPDDDEDSDGMEEFDRNESPASAVASIARILENPEGAVNEFMTRIHTDDSDDDYGFLEPDGTFHPVPWGKHAEWANNWLEEHYPVDQNPKLYQKPRPEGSHDYIFDGDVLVYKLGWVLIDSPSQGFGRHTCRSHRSMTKAQIEFLYDYYMKRGMTDDANALYDDDM